MFESKNSESGMTFAVNQLITYINIELALLGFPSVAGADGAKAPDIVAGFARSFRKRTVCWVSSSAPPQAAAVEQALGYFVRNASRLQHGTFRAAGWFFGSRVVEAGCRTVIDGRCKQSVMSWSKSGAETSARCAGFRAAVVWRTSGKTDSINTRLATTPCRSRHKGRILSHTRLRTYCTAVGPSCA